MFAISSSAESYARSLYKISLERNVLKNVYGDMLKIVELFEMTPSITSFLDNKTVKIRDRRDLMMKLLQEIKASDVTNLFIRMLIENGRLNIISQIMNRFEVMNGLSEGYECGYVIIASEIDNDALALISDFAERKLNKKLRLKVYKRPAIIGGFIIIVGSQVMDCSDVSKIEFISSKIDGYISQIDFLEWFYN